MRSGIRLKTQNSEFQKYRSFEGTDFLTAITLLANYLNKADTPDQKGVSCKKKDVLKLKFQDYSLYKDRLLDGLNEAVKFLAEQCVYTAIDLPYTSQLIPLSVLFAVDKKPFGSPKATAKSLKNGTGVAYLANSTEVPTKAGM